MRVVYIRWDAIKVVLSSRPFVVLLSSSLALFHPVPFFLPLHSLLFISFASFLSLLAHVYTSSVYTERGKFRRSALYLRSASTSNGFDVLGRNAYLSRAECVCTHACVGRFLMRARARAFRSRATRDTARRADEEGFTHTHTHGCELCLARDVKLLAIS